MLKLLKVSCLIKLNLIIVQKIKYANFYLKVRISSLYIKNNESFIHYIRKNLF